MLVLENVKMFEGLPSLDIRQVHIMLPSPLMRTDFSMLYLFRSTSENSVDQGLVSGIPHTKSETD